MSIDRAKLRWNGWGLAAHRDALAEREEVWHWLAAETGMPALLATPPHALEEIALPAGRLDAEDRARLAAILGADRLCDDAHERAFHALGRSCHDLLRLRMGEIAAVPDAVLYPRAAEEVLAILAYASERGIAVIPFGGGTGAVGGANAGAGSFKAAITLDLSAMDRLVALDAESGIATAEAGITGAALEKALEARGFTLGHRPESFEFSTLGGWIASGAGQDWLLGATLATPRGLLATGSDAQLKNLVIGSEGAFGIVTEARLRVRPLPAARDTRAFLFPDFASGLAAIRAAERQGVRATLHLSDTDETRFRHALDTLGRPRDLKVRLRDFLHPPHGEGALLIADFAGTARDAARARHSFARIAYAGGARLLGRGPGAQWRATRFEGPYLRDSLLERGLAAGMLDAAADWTALPALYRSVREALAASMVANAPREGARGLVLCRTQDAHSDGASLCFTFVFPRILNGEIAQWAAIRKDGLDAARAAGGAVCRRGTGEDLMAWAEAEKGAEGIAVLRAIKAVLDPRGILNPGKLIPP